MRCGANEQVSSELDTHLTADRHAAASALPTDLRLIDGA